MNFKLIALMTAMSMSAAIAQDYEDEEEEEESAPAATSQSSGSESESAQESSSAAAASIPDAQDAPAVTQTNGVFNVLHGNAYNLVGSEAGASTIGGNMHSPYKMYGSNLLYVEPSGENATLALTKGGLTYMFAFDNTASLGGITAGLPIYDAADLSNIGIITAGVAFKGMGLAIDFGLDKVWNSEEVGDNETDESITAAGDIINLKFGMLLGAFDLTANAYWLTFQDEEDEDGGATETDNDYWDLGLNVAISNAPSAKNFFWSAGINILRQSSETTTKMGGTKTEVTHEDAFFALQPYMNFALPVLASDIAQVFVGTNTRIPLVFFDETDSDRSGFGVFTTPNILAEVTLSENWIVYGGANYDWLLFGYEGEEIEKSKTDRSSISMRTNAPMANAGVRFQYKNLILEASIADQLNSAAWAGLVGNFGALLTF
ncbi:MAG: hypothetical protein MJY87_05765 [Fibrobacter sp.]|nr:hypothetical protein [Fibrobacter sp.]